MSRYLSPESPKSPPQRPHLQRPAFPVAIFEKQSRIPGEQILFRTVALFPPNSVSNSGTNSAPFTAERSREFKSPFLRHGILYQTGLQLTRQKRGSSIRSVRVF